MKRRINLWNKFASVIIIFAFYVTAPVQSAEKSGLVLENDHVLLEFTEGDMGLSGMIDKICRINHIAYGSENYLLWELVFKRGTQEVTLSNCDVPCTDSRIRNLEDGTQRAVMEWDGIRFWREDNAVSVRVTVDLPKNSGIAQWRISVENNSTVWGLWEVRFPYFSQFLTSGEYDVAVPGRNWGYLYKKAEEEYKTSMYPSGSWSMPFISASSRENSVYLAALDPEVWAKRAVIHPGGNFYFTTYVEDMGEPGSDYSGHYGASIGVYRGNWFTACKMYRSWALKQYWTRKGLLSQRADIPKSIKELGLWMLSGWEFGEQASGAKTPHEQNLPLIYAQKYFGVPVGLHWYNWHHNRFDNEYPHFFPPKPGFRERVDELVSNGLLIMPYINALISDYDNVDYKEVILPNAAKDQAGIPYMHIYGTASGRMTPMCVSTEYWQDKIATLVDSLTGYYGVNAVYLDQLSATSPILCFDRSHGHPLGGGGWWFKGYQELLEKVQAVADRRNIAITSENVCEVYMNGVDGFLSWIKRDEAEIPMMPAVYSGYTLYFSSPAWLNAGDRSFIAVQGRDFAWGCQNGWMGFELFDNPIHKDKLAYLKRIGQYRMKCRKFLTYGELVNIISPTKPVDTIKEQWATHRGKSKTAALPCVMGALWRAEDGNLGVFLTNFLNETYTYHYEITPADFGLNPGEGGQYKIIQITPEDRTILGYHYPGTIQREETLEPREIRVLEIVMD